MALLAYDVEVLPNYFSIAIIDVNDYLRLCEEYNFDNASIEVKRDVCSKVRKVIYELYNEDDSQLFDIVKILEAPNNTFVGFNTSRYDRAMLACFLMYYKRYSKVSALIKHLYETSGKIIKSMKDNTNDNSLALLYKYKFAFHEIDLMKVFALDKSFKSLKQTSINLCWFDLREFHRGVVTDEERKYYNYRDDITNEQITKLRDEWDRYLIDSDRELMRVYNFNDVFICCELMRQKQEEIQLRYDITNDYHVNCLSSSRSNIADVLFLQWYKDKTGIDLRNFKPNDYRNIKIGECIMDCIHFTSDNLNTLLSSLREAIIVSINEDVLKQLVTVGNTQYQMGAGGLHSVDKPAIFISNDEYVYRDADVTSYYPHIIKYMRVKPRHMVESAWFEIVEFLITERVNAKKAGNKVTAEALKIVINSIFGKLGFEFGFMYDRKALIQVTLNGQLLLLMLIERLEAAGFMVISANTDGIVTQIPRDRESEYHAICDQWMVDTQFNLEFADYEKYIRVHVNSYISLKPDDPNNPKPTSKRLKMKSSMNPYLYREDLSKGFNCPIVAMAIADHFINGGEVMDYIKSCKNILMFCKTQNVDKSYDVVIDKVVNGKVIREQLQRNNRYFISLYGGVLKKVRGKEEANLVSGEYVTIANEIEDTPVEQLEIKYSYYYDEAMKIINQIRLGMNTKSRSKLKKQFGMYKSLFD